MAPIWPSLPPPHTHHPSLSPTTALLVCPSRSKCPYVDSPNVWHMLRIDANQLRISGCDICAVSPTESHCPPVRPPANTLCKFLHFCFWANLMWISDISKCVSVHVSVSYLQAILFKTITYVIKHKSFWYIMLFHAASHLRWRNLSHLKHVYPVAF